MTEKEALKEARKRWGRSAWVSEGIQYYVGFKKRVGRRTDFIYKGEGTTWENAFRDADRQERMK